MISMASLSSPCVGVGLLSLLSAGTNAAASTSPIRYRDGRLSGRIDNQPLNKVLRELDAATGARFVLNDPENGQSPVSAAVESQLFVDGVKRILEGFSYAIYPMGDRELPAVIVLSTPPVQRSSGVSGATRQRPASGETRAAPMPTVLLQEAAGEAEALAREQAEREEILNRSIANLRTKDGQLNQQALDQLVGIHNEPRATEALIQAASGTQDSHNRVRAAEALWHHAADLQFADETSISALEQLATDTDAGVQKTARQALEDMRQYRQHNSSP
jgi:hypothetical protein